MDTRREACLEKRVKSKKLSVIFPSVGVSNSVFSVLSVRNNDFVKFCHTIPNSLHTNKTARQGNKTARQGNKTTRQGNKTTRQGNKTTRQGNKTTRQGNKTTRQGNKTTRQGNKTARQGNKTARQGNKKQCCTKPIIVPNEQIPEPHQHSHRESKSRRDEIIIANTIQT